MTISRSDLIKELLPGLNKLFSDGYNGRNVYEVLKNEQAAKEINELVVSTQVHGVQEVLQSEP